MPNPVADLLELLGGKYVACRMFRIGTPTLKRWLERGIPHFRRYQIAAIVAQHGLPADLVPRLFPVNHAQAA